MPADSSLGLGRPATQQELSRFFAIPPDGAGLPEGSGSVAQGARIYVEKCMMCHGDKLQGVKANGGLPLVGRGRRYGSCGHAQAWALA